MILSMIAEQVGADLMWLTTILSILLFWHCWPASKTKDDISEEGVIDLYHHTSRRLYCTAQSFRILTDEEAQNIDNIRYKEKRAIKGRVVKYEESKRAKVWGENHEPSIIYGQVWHV